MKETSNYRTKTNFNEKDNGRIPGVFVIGLDVGYSAVKYFSPIADGRFPSYARKVDKDFAYAGEAPKSSILYKDLETNECWLVGEKAQDTMSASDTSDSDAVLYSRERYGSDIFRVILSTGIGLSLIPNQYGSLHADDKIVVQTGLPEKYLIDTENLTGVIADKFHFALKIGTKDWEELCFSIDKSNVYTMSQPKGTLLSVCFNKNGLFTQDAAKYLSSSVLVFDPGFGTLDIFPILSGVVGKGETYSNLGMRRILQDTCEALENQYRVSIPVPAMQKYLSTGTVKHVDKKTFETNEIAFGDILAEATDRVCDEAINKLSQVFDLGEYEYLIVTGGTGSAWFNKIKEKLGKAITIVPGNLNDDRPFVFSNVRGYYMFRTSMEKKRQAKNT